VDEGVIPGGQNVSHSKDGFILSSFRPKKNNLLDGLLFSLLWLSFSRGWGLGWCCGLLFCGLLGGLFFFSHSWVSVECQYMAFTIWSL
jgi:hypothetical protein